MRVAAIPWVRCLVVATAACGNGKLRPVDAGDGPPPVEADAEVPDAAPPCPAPGGPTMHTTGSVRTDEVWAAADNPHVVPLDVTITATLTLEPCVEVQVGAQHSLTVRQGGALVAEGTAAQPIRIHAIDAAAPFAQLHTAPGGTIRLVHTTVEDGGDPLNRVPEFAGVLDLQGADQTLPPQATLFVDHVTVRGSGSNGLILYDGAGFAPGSTDLTVESSTLYPIHVWSRAAGTVPVGRYTGNGADEILLTTSRAQEAVQEDVTFHDRGVPYHVGHATSQGDLRVERAPNTGLATLTIEPGVTLRFKRGGGLYVQFATGDAPATGALVAVGTAAKPIVFTSAADTPAAGDWLGVHFGLIPDARNRLDHVRIEYAGALSNGGSNACPLPSAPVVSGAIRIYGLPPSVFVTNTEIVASQRHGIDRGWRANERPSFLDSNTFTNVGGCKETFPRDANGGCPDPVPCP